MERPRPRPSQITSLGRGPPWRGLGDPQHEAEAAEAAEVFAAPLRSNLNRSTAFPFPPLVPVQGGACARSARRRMRHRAHGAGDAGGNQRCPYATRKKQLNVNKKILYINYIFIENYCIQ